MKRFEFSQFRSFSLSSIANEASTQHSRVSSTAGNQRKYYCSPDEGAFAALMDSQSDPAPTPKSTKKTEKTEPRDSAPSQPATPASQGDASQAPDAATAPENAPAQAEQDPCAQIPEETALPVEEPKAAKDTEANTDPIAAVAAPVVVDPNAVAVPAAVVSIPTALAPTEGEAPAEIAMQPAAVDGAPAPVLPVGDENTGPAKKAAGKQAPQVQAPAQDAKGSTEEADPDQTVPADQPQAPEKHAKPQVPPQQAEGTQQQTADDKAQTKPAGDADSTASAAKISSEPPAHHLTTPAAPVATHAAAASAAASQGAPVVLSQPVPVNALAVEIAGQARAGNSRFEIRLDPPELGRIDVRLDVDRDGNVTSRLVIDRADTYDLLRRDQSTLERALQQAGLKTSDNSLEFQLRDQGFTNQQQQEDKSARGNTTLIADADANPTEAASGYARMLRSGGGIDIRV
jgi:chemotaxis protein MotD